MIIKYLHFKIMYNFNLFNKIGYGCCKGCDVVLEDSDGKWGKYIYIINKKVIVIKNLNLNLNFNYIIIIIIFILFIFI